MHSLMFGFGTSGEVELDFQISREADLEGWEYAV